MSIASFIVIGILLFAAGLGRKLKDPVSFWFFYLVLFNFLSALPELIIGELMGTPGTGLLIAIKILNYLTYAAGALGMVAFSHYVYAYLSTKTAVSRRPRQIADAISLASLVFTAVAEATNLFSGYDAFNNYHKSDLYWVGYVPNVAVFLICFAVVAKHRKSLRVREWLALALYAVIPTLCYGIESFYAEVWIVYFGIAVTLLLIYIAIQVELMQTIQRQNEELTKSRTAIMLSQIQPHFLYNSLASIQLLCRTNPPEAEKAVRDFSQYLRGNLDFFSSGQMAPFAEELERTRLYLSLEQRRFHERLAVEFDIQAEDFEIPKLTLQPIVENAVRHGVTKREDGGKIIIRTSKTAGARQVTVQDNGVGFNTGLPAAPSADHAGIGIENVRGRLAALCGGTLDIQSAPGAGTTAVISIPIGGEAAP